MQQKAKTLEQVGLLDQSPDGKSVVEYLERLRRGDTPICIKCGSVGKFTRQRQLGRYWCKDGQHYFNAWHGTPLEYGKIA